MKVKLGFFYDAWKAIADWIKGESSDKPKVEVDGTVEVSKSTNNAAGSWRSTSHQPARSPASDRNRTLASVDKWESCYNQIGTRNRGKDDHYNSGRDICRGF